MGGILNAPITRRRFLAASATTIGAAALTVGAQCDAAFMRRLAQARTAGAPHHVVWVWQFSADGSPQQIATVLAANNLAITMKTHDGVEWMSTYDHHPSAINGPAQVSALANYFETAGVPFHAWCVIRGADPAREAGMAADVLGAGARSLILDLEGSSGFWLGTPDDAARYCDELRRRMPNARVDISIDARPWRINLVPMRPFVDATDGIWPQLYWDTFNTPSNVDAFRFSGYPAGTNGITPEFLLDTTYHLLQQYDRQVIPVGQGATADPGTWPRFVQRAWNLGMGTTSVWRYAVTASQTLAYLGANPAGQAPQPQPTTPTATPTTAASPTRTPVPPTRTPTNTSSPVPQSTSTPII